MGPQNGVSLLVIGLTVVAMTIVSMLYPRTIQEYWRRPCMGTTWKRTFPHSSTDDIRQFLNMFVDAFAFTQRRALQFALTDRVLAIYHDLYPQKGWTDALEFETLSVQLERRYALDLRKIWREELTLGEIFSRIATAAARRSTSSVERMSRACPSCHTSIPYLFGVGLEIRPPEKSGKPWWKFARRRFFCRSCGTELRAVTTPVGYVIISFLIVVSLLNFLALATGHFNGAALIFGDLAAVIILASFDIRWGHTLRLS